MLTLGLHIKNNVCKAQATPVTITNLVTDGNYETDLSSWYVGYGTIGVQFLISSDVAKYGTKSLKQVFTGDSPHMTRDIANIPLGHTVYCCTWGYRVSGTLQNSQCKMYDYGTENNFVPILTRDALNASTNTWIFSSATKTLITNGVRLRIGSLYSDTAVLYQDGLMLIDMTACGKTKDELDTLIQSVGYFTTRVV